jgi:hypothetical protein
MQSIGKPIESRTDSALNACVEQSPARGHRSGNGAASFGTELLPILEAVRAHGRKVSGVWRDLTVSENSTAQSRNLADVTIAVADSDLSKEITVDMHGGWCLRTSREAGQYGAAAVCLKDVAASLIGGENARR